MKVEFENIFQKKVMVISFPNPAEISSINDIRGFRSQWTQALQSWHSPYKALIDGKNLTVDGSPEMAQEWKRMLSFLEGFFLKSALVYNYDKTKGHDYLPFDHDDEATARSRFGLGQKRRADSSDFRSSISIQNHFQQHVMEVSFDKECLLKSEEQLQALKSKITNNLMQWHSAWNLLIDCSHLEIDGSMHQAFQEMLEYFRSFFLKKVLGYSPMAAKGNYPFDVYRARHGAAGRLEAEGFTAGNDANCSSRKT